MSHAEVSIQPDALLSAVTANLDLYFFSDSRDSAKQLFKVLANGDSTPFMKIDMGDSGEVFCELCLDASLHTGKLNFSKFRKALAMMMLSVDKRLKAEESLNLMHSDSGEMLFNIPGILKSQDATNVLVCGMRQKGPGLAEIKLMYLDSAEYAKAAGAEPKSQN